MNPNDRQPSREDVLDAFAVEPSHDQATLERYLTAYPQFAREVVDLSIELSRIAIEPLENERPLSSQELHMIDASWRQRLAAGTSAAKNPFADLPLERLRAIATQLDVPRQVIVAFRERRVIARSVPARFLVHMAALLNRPIDQVVSWLTDQSSPSIGRSYKSDGKPAVDSAVTFEQLLVEAGVSTEKIAVLLADD